MPCVIHWRHPLCLHMAGFGCLVDARGVGPVRARPYAQRHMAEQVLPQNDVSPAVEQGGGPFSFRPLLQSDTLGHFSFYIFSCCCVATQSPHCSLRVCIRLGHYIGVCACVFVAASAAIHGVALALVYTHWYVRSLVYIHWHVRSLVYIHWYVSLCMCICA